MINEKIKRYTKLYIFLLITIGFIIGMFVGMILQQQILYLGLGEMLKGLEGTTFNIEVDINETLMVDRVTENMEPIIWNLRMENCTKTEKGYCALECYENNNLIPCENFTDTEVFCNNGICKREGGCPTYYERLRGKTIGDCIREVVANE